MGTFTIKLSELMNDGFNFGLTPLDYPIFDEDYREGLNTKILRHYWNYEIGQETESMFRFSLNRKMNEIMPLYNQLYTSQALVFDPLKTVNYSDMTSTTDHASGDRTDSSTTTGTGNSAARSVNSDTPQVLLSPNEDYASGAVNTVSESTTGGTGATTASHTDDAAGTISRTVDGLQGISGSALLMEFRATMLNIDLQVIGELSELFMQIWDNGDEFSCPSMIGGVGYGFPFINGGIL